MIPYGRQEITDADIEAVVEVLKSAYITQGPVVSQFEKAVAQYCGAKYGTATNSATSALHLACRALGLGPGDYLWTSPISFVASANCGIYCGADIDFVDIDPRTYNLSAEALEEKLVSAERNGTLPKVVVPVHLAGQSCDMEAIYRLSQRFGFYIVEDASHAIGARYRTDSVGSCRYSDITVFSFHPVKLITTGEGGMAVTNSEDIASKMRLLRNHGITRDRSIMSSPEPGEWYYQQIDLGFNYRMTDIQAALGISQLQRLDGYIEHRRVLASRYNVALRNLPVICPWQHPDADSAYHLYIIRVRVNTSGKTRRVVFDQLRRAGIGVNVHYIPIHLQPYYRRRGFKRGDFPEAERYYDEALTLPLFPTLSEKEQERIVDAIRDSVST